MAEWIYRKKKKKKDPTICCLQETHFTFKDAHWLKVKQWKTYIPFKWKPKESRSSYTYIRKKDFNSKYNERQRKSLCNAKEVNLSIGYQIVNIVYTHNIRAPKYIKQVLTDLKEKIDSNAVI